MARNNALNIAKNAVVSAAVATALTKATQPGSSFVKTSFPAVIFRPTTMSLALERAGVLPGTHLVPEQARTGLIRHRLDGDNSYRSVSVAL